MNEIKEILDFKENADYKKLSCDEIKVLIDYITNLQRENERLKDQNINEILKNDLKICAKQYKKSDEKLEKYKSRIEKAIEYIENTPLYETTYDYNMEEELEIQNVSDETASNKLLEILNGRSDE